MVGPVVRDVSASFDKFWNSPSAYPMELLDPEASTTAALERCAACWPHTSQRSREQPLRAALRENDARERLMAGDWPLQWSAKYQFVSDDPAQSDDEGARCEAHAGWARRWLPMIQAAQTRVSIISPYFVPGDERDRAA